TYVAKHVAPWPEAGVRYAASFVLEYSWWLLLALSLVAAVVLVRRRPAAGDIPWTERLAGLVIVGALLGHAGYYTLVIGGDHFEYRVYAQLVPLGWVAAIAVVARVASSPRQAIGLV